MTTSDHPPQDWEGLLEQKIADIRAGRRQTFTLDDVEAELGLAD